MTKGHERVERCTQSVSFAWSRPRSKRRLKTAITLLEQKKYRQAWTPINAALEAEPGRKDLYPIRAFLRCS